MKEFGGRSRLQVWYFRIPVNERPGIRPFPPEGPTFEMPVRGVRGDPMAEGEKSSSNMPTILVAIFAIFGLANFPQGGGKPLDSPPKVVESETKSGGSRAAGDDEHDLGPLATIKAQRALDGVWNPPVCPEATLSADAKQPGELNRDAILASEPEIRFLIVLVPDPDNTSMSHEFDLTLSAVQRATESAGFVGVRWSEMPGFPPATKSPLLDSLKPISHHLKGTLDGKDVDLALQNKKAGSDATKWPAAVLCRPSSATKTGVEGTKLLLLLVPESPTRGVDKARLVQAVKLAGRHKVLHANCKKHEAASLPIRLVGPNFSGSVISMVEALKPLQIDLPAKADAPAVIVYNGRAVAPKLEHFSNLSKGWIRFRSTVLANSVLEDAMRAFVRETSPWGQKPRFAILVESNTRFGQATKTSSQSEVSDTEYFSFPLNISQIREEYAAKGYLRSKEPMKLQSPERLTPLEMAGQHGDHDLIPTVTPGPSAVGGELALSQILLALERGRFSWVGIVATNPYDRLFLAEKVRESCPDVRLFFTSASTLYVHHTVVPYLRGTLIASTYPLDPDSQTWTASPGWSEPRGKNNRVAFGNYYEEGIYNATVAHLDNLNLDDTPNFLDYAYPGKDYKDSDEKAVPSVWISVVGQRGLYPVSVGTPDPKSTTAPDEKNYPELGGLYRSDKSSVLPEVATRGLLDPSWVVILIMSAFGAIVVSLWYLWTSLGYEAKSAPAWWPAWANVSPGLRQLIDHHSARKLAAVGASAGFGHMILLSAPVWLMILMENLVTVGVFQKILIVGLTALAILGLAGTAVLSLFRMVFGNRAESIGLGEAIYRGLAAVVWCGQFALPLFLLASLIDGSDLAARRIYCARATRLVNGVSPLVPFLFLGVAGAVVMIGDWLRVGLRIRANATGHDAEIETGPLGVVWKGFEEARDILDHPLKAWSKTGFLMTLPVGVALALLVIALSDGLPRAIEPNWQFIYVVLLAFGTTLGLLVFRIVDLIGLARVAERLLRRMAEMPMIHALDRLPAHFAQENFWRLNATPLKAEDDSDPRVDRQFEAVVKNYNTLKSLGVFMEQPHIVKAPKQFGVFHPAVFKGQPHFAKASKTFETFLKHHSSVQNLPTGKWSNSVAALTPFLAPFWAARPAIVAPSEGDKKAEGDNPGDWVGLGDEADLKRWLRSTEDLIAMIMVRQIAWLRSGVTSIISFLVAGLLLLTFVMTSYPFEPQGPTLALLGVLTMITVGAIVVIAVQASRDEVLSRLNKTATDRFTLDRHFLTMMITFVAPLLGLLGALSYSLSDLFRSLFEPFFRGG